MGSEAEVEAYVLSNFDAVQNAVNKTKQFFDHIEDLLWDFCYEAVERLNNNSRLFFNLHQKQCVIIDEDDNITFSCANRVCDKYAGKTNCPECGKKTRTLFGSYCIVQRSRAGRLKTVCIKCLHRFHGRKYHDEISYSNDKFAGHIFDELNPVLKSMVTSIDMDIQDTIEETFSYFDRLKRKLDEDTAYFEKNMLNRQSVSFWSNNKYDWKSIYVVGDDPLVVLLFCFREKGVSPFFIL
jgi:hypothetical protein